MKIAVIHSIYKPDARGGAEVAVENIVHGLKKQGHDVLVVSVGRKKQQKNIDGIRVYKIKPINLFNFLDINSRPAWLRFFWHIMDMFNDLQTLQIYKVLKKEKPDLVFTHNLKGLGYYIPWLIHIMKINHVHTVHDMQLIHPSGLLQPGQKLSLPIRTYAWLCQKLFSPVTKIVFPSEYIKTIYNQHGFFHKAKSIVLGNPIELEVTSQKPKVESCQFPRLLFLGQVEEYKGIFDLINVTKRIKRKFSLQIVGDGSALIKARELASDDDRIIFTGRLDQKELESRIWPNVDLLINPTKVPESFGMVVAEAGAHGVPSLSSNIGALPELIENNKTGLPAQTGWLFEAGNQESLFGQLDTISSHICASGSIGLLCRESIKRFESKSYLNKLIEFVNITKS